MEKNKIDLLFSLGSPLIVVGDAEIAAAIIGIRYTEHEAAALWDLPRARRGALPFPTELVACLQAEAKVFVVGMHRSDSVAFAHEYRANGPDRPLRHISESEIKDIFEAALDAGWTKMEWEKYLLEGQLILEQYKRPSVDTPEDA
ncbi:MAG: hypothetical protein ACRYG8_55035 [Janthinobacterium lividum]